MKLFFARSTVRFLISFPILLALSIGFLGCGSVESAFQSDPESKLLVEKLSNILKTGRNISNEQLSQLKATYEKYPQAGTVRSTYQVALSKRQDWRTLREVLKSIPEQDRTFEDVLNLAKAHFKIGDYQKTIATLEPIKDSQDFEPRSVLAQSNFYLGNLGTSREIIDSNWKRIIDEKRDGDMALRGLIHLHENESEKAVEVLTHALEINPKNIPAANTLSRAYSILDKPDLADKYKQRVERLFDEVTKNEQQWANLVSKINMLQSEYRAGRYQRTIDLAKDVLPQVKGRQKAIIYQYLARSYEKLGQKSQAQSAMAEARKLQK